MVCNYFVVLFSIPWGYYLRQTTCACKVSGLYEPAKSCKCPFPALWSIFSITLVNALLMLVSIYWNKWKIGHKVEAKGFSSVTKMTIPFSTYFWSCDMTCNTNCNGCSLYYQLVSYALEGSFHFSYSYPPGCFPWRGKPKPTAFSWGTNVFRIQA